MELIELQPGASEAFGHSDLRPIRRPIAGAFEAFGIDIRFDQEDRMAIALEPIRTEHLGVSAQDLGSPIGRLAFGLEPWPLPNFAIDSGLPLAVKFVTTKKVTTAMKTNLSSLRWVLALALVLPTTLHAQFDFVTNNGTITITGYTGPGGDVLIPSATNGLPGPV